MNMKAIYPDIWGIGGKLFAFSGMDGYTDIYDQLVCSLANHNQRLDIYTKPSASIRFRFNFNDPIYKNKIATNDICVYDVCSETDKIECKMAAVNKSAIIGEILAIDECQTSIDIYLSMDSSKCITDNDSITLISSEDSISFCVKAENYYISPNLFHIDLNSAKPVLWALIKLNESTCLKNNIFDYYDIHRLIDDRLSFFNSLPLPSGFDSEIIKTYFACASIQKVNCCTAQNDIHYNWSTPDRWPHKYMWIWDSAFHALGYRHFAKSWAMDSLKAVADKINPNGFLPHMMTPSSEMDSSIIQPPILAWSAYRVFEKTSDISFLEFCYPKILKMLKYDLHEIDSDNDGLPEWGDGCASGMDNSPRFDNRIGAAVDLSSFIVNDLKYMMKISELIGNTTDISFIKNEINRLSELINSRFWDNDSGFYFDLDIENRKIPLKAISGFTPMFAGICDDQQASVLVGHLTSDNEFWRKFPVPSVSADEPSFSDDMWRGPVWINYNYMIIEGLKQYGYYDIASDITDKTISEISKWYNLDGLIYEYYDSEGKLSPSRLRRKGHTPSPEDTWPLGRCIRDYHWTAALFIDMLLNK